MPIAFPNSAVAHSAWYRYAAASSCPPAARLQPPLSSFPRGDILCRNVNSHALHCAYSGLYTSPRFIPSFEYPSMITFAVMKINETLLPYPPRRVIPSSKYCNKGKHRLIYRRSRHCTDHTISANLFSLSRRKSYPLLRVATNNSANIFIFCMHHSFRCTTKTKQTAPKNSPRYNAIMTTAPLPAKLSESHPQRQSKPPDRHADAEQKMCHDPDFRRKFRIMTHPDAEKANFATDSYPRHAISADSNQYGCARCVTIPKNSPKSESCYIYGGAETQTRPPQ